MIDNILRKIVFLSVFIFINTPSVFSQYTVIDSLLYVLKNQNAHSKEPSIKDTARVSTLNLICQQYIYSRDFSTAMKYARISQNISEKLIKINNDNKSKLCLANSLKSVGQIYASRGDFNNALEQYKKELVLREEIGNKKETAICMNTIGIMYNYLDDLAQSLEYFFKALKTMEASGDESKMAVIYNSLGIAYGRQRNPAKALEYYKKELALGEKLNDKNAIATAHTNIGTIFAEEGKYNEALNEFTQFLEVAEEANDQYNIGLCLLNMGDIYSRKGDHVKALETNGKAMKIFEELGSKYEAGLIYFNQGSTYLSMARTNSSNKTFNLLQAKNNLDNALSLFEKGAHIEDMSVCYSALSTLDSCRGNDKGALDYYKKYIRYRDSLLSQENTAKSIRAEMNYEFDKKESASNLEQEKKEVVAKQENERQKSIRNLFIIAFAFMVILAVIIFRGYHQKRKINRLISYQKKEVEEQKSLVEKNQKQIIDSINYAKRIQGSILSSDSILKKALPQSFIFYKPKDIVSGDFYWFYSIPNTNETIIVVADCTGHGVPGAFLSMVGSTLLNEIVGHKNITDPAGIIKALNTGLTTTLVAKQKEQTHSDGMDISICKIDSVNRTLHFAGANQCVYLITDGKIDKIESQIISINGVFDLPEDPNFQSIQKNIYADSGIFITTDGYADQMGEQTRKKFLSSRFEKLITEINPLSSLSQLECIEKTFEDWKGHQKQIDDILVIGIKL